MHAIHFRPLLEQRPNLTVELFVHKADREGPFGADVQKWLDALADEFGTRVSLLESGAPLIPLSELFSSSEV